MDIVTQLDLGPMEMDKISGQAGIILLVFFHSWFLKTCQVFLWDVARNKIQCVHQNITDSVLLF